ncbi:MAG TPA: pyrimidine dimer DNA glycosylase/endonuclease V [Burkholderiales bacterium]|nr:pyrimidine dimer DNA glycosylase/endonuclease V [Burkholderiales bacterium]
MRLWSWHPRYLDARGLAALWRESLRARAVLRGQARGCRHHPQLLRLRRDPDPRRAIEAYRAAVWAEAARRGYSFDRSKFGPCRPVTPTPCTSGQLGHEWRHLLRKLRSRSPATYRACCALARPVPHPLFRVTSGPVEDWERARGRAPAVSAPTSSPARRSRRASRR